MKHIINDRIVKRTDIIDSDFVVEKITNENGEIIRFDVRIGDICTIESDGKIAFNKCSLSPVQIEIICSLSAKLTYDIKYWPTLEEPKIPGLKLNLNLPEINTNEGIQYFIDSFNLIKDLKDLSGDDYTFGRLIKA